MPKSRASYPGSGQSNWKRSPAARATILVAAAIAALGVAGAGETRAQGLVSEGDVVVTQFSGVRRAGGVARPNPDGAVARVFGLASPNLPPDGSVIESPGLLFTVTARDVGQVLGIAFDDAREPNVYLAASSAYGLFRNRSGWADGMWGPEGGPGTIWKLDAERGYAPMQFSTVNGDNGGAALGDLAFDPWHGQLLVSELESGLIHRIDIDTGEVLEAFDHGRDGRPMFADAQTGESVVRDVVAYDDRAKPYYEDCKTDGSRGEEADFQETPACWNFADFRRRVWGLGVARDPDGGAVRVYYAIWGGAALGSEGWDEAGEETRTSVWSVALDETGAFDPSDVRREFVLLPATAASAEAAAPMNPVTDIAFTDNGAMILVERAMPWLESGDGGAAAEPRVFAATRGDDGVWQPVEQAISGVGMQPAGGVGAGHGFTAEGKPDNAAVGTAWLTVDGLCDADGICVGGQERETATDGVASGLAAVPLDTIFPEGDEPVDGPAASYAVIVADAGARAGSIGDVEVYVGGDPSMRIVDVEPMQPAQAGEPAPPADENELASQEGAPDEPRAPEIAAIDVPTDLALSVSGPEVCEPGGECTFEVTLENAGDTAFDGPVLLTGTPDASGIAVGPSTTAAWTCEMADAAVLCQAEDLSLPAGETATLDVTLALPEGFSSPRLEYCTSLAWLARQGRERIRAVQGQLHRQGYEPGPVDGAMGPRTRGEISEAEGAFGLPETGEISGALVEKLFGAGSYMSGDGNADNDRDCLRVTINLPPGAQVQSRPARRQQQAAPGYHGTGESAYHDPATSSPGAYHGLRDSWFHAQRGSGTHDWRSSRSAGMHSLALSQFHRGYDSGVHDALTTGIAARHWPHLSQFHTRFDSSVHDGINTRLVPPHDPRTSYMLPMRGRPMIDFHIPEERRVEATDGAARRIAQSGGVSGGTDRRPIVIQPRINRGREFRSRQMDLNRTINRFRLNERMESERNRQRDNRRIYNPFLER